MEIYKDIKGFEGRYQVSNFGNIKSIRKNGSFIIKKQHKERGGYMLVGIGKKTVTVHKLVAQTFIGKIPEGYEVNHIDLNRANNHVDNLEICTRSENMKHAYKFGSVKVPDNSGEKNGMSKLTKEDVLQIRELAKTNMPKISIMNQFKISRSALSFIVKRKRWAHI
jgi:hypothetical protein